MRIRILHLDFMSEERKKELFLKEINPMVESIILVATPRAILQKGSGILTALVDLYESDVLRLLCLDETHLIVEDGISYRDDFRQVCMLIKDIVTGVATLGMTATMTEDYLRHFEDATFVNFDDIIWAAPQEISRRDDIMIEFHPREQAGKHVASLINKHLETRDTNELMVVFTNTQDLVTSIARKTREVVVSCHDRTVVHLVTGDTDSQAKTAIVQHLSGKVQFKECSIVVANTQCMVCGTNFKEVTTVVSAGFPAAPSRIEQEKGRNRGKGVYVMVPSLKDLCYLWARPSFESAAHGAVKFARNQLMESLKLLVLGKECIHFKLAKHFGREGGELGLPVCDKMYFVCSGRLSTDYKQRVHVESLKKA
jgi:superfamily II DNA helicase RecQ